MGQAVAAVQPREAASVILLREPDLVYMTARPQTLRVAAGFYVFPGGRVDEPDRVLAGVKPEQLLVAPLDGRHAFFVAAAVREVFEEVGLLLARDGQGRPLWQAEGAGAQRRELQEARTLLNEERADLADVLRLNGWTVAADRLAYVSRWVTPPAARRRFDTRFFVAEVTDSIDPVPDPGEVERGEWIPLAQTLARDEAGTLPLMHPTRSLLHTLAAIGGARQIVSYYRKTASPRLEVVERNTPEVLQSLLASHGVSMIPVPSPTLLPAVTTNVYLISAGGEALIIDAGNGGEAGIGLVLNAWERAGRPKVNALVLTHDHTDHAGAAAELSQRLECPVAAHTAAVPRLQERRGLTPDIVLQGGETLCAGRRRVEIIHAPGHASDHITLYETETGFLYAGDNVVGQGSSWVGPPDGDMAAYLQSLAHLETMRINVICPGHGPLLDDGPLRIRALIERRLAREADILGLIRERSRTAEEIFALLYADRVPPSVADMARRTVLGHLIKLEDDGRVSSSAGPDGATRYEAAPTEAQP